MLATTTNHRSVGLEALIEALKDEANRRLDVVATPAALRAEGGNLLLQGTGAVEMNEDGVTPVAGRFKFTSTAINTMATRLGIPGSYLTRVHAFLPNLFDQTVNGWLDWQAATNGNKPIMVRAFGSGNGDGHGIVRAVLSNRYGSIDNFEILTAVLGGLRASGVEAEVSSADLSEKSMYVRIHVPGVAQLAPDLLRGYQTPFRADGDTRVRVMHGIRLAEQEGMGYEPGTEPVVFAGLILRNSEVGSGAYSLYPQVVVQVCKNGLTYPIDGMRRNHVGATMESGMVRSSHQTDQRLLQLVSSQTSDLVEQIMTPRWLAGKVDEITADAGVEVKLPEKTIEVVTKKLGFSEVESQNILAHFLLGGQRTAGGIMQAVSSVAQVTEDPDAAYALELAAPKALAEAAKFCA